MSVWKRPGVTQTDRGIDIIHTVRYGLAVRSIHSHGDAGNNVPFSLNPSCRSLRGESNTIGILHKKHNDHNGQTKFLLQHSLEAPVSDLIMG
ncbi:hypothetical protein D3C73_1455570 [compost metagenome]